MFPLYRPPPERKRYRVYARYLFRSLIRFTNRFVACFSVILLLRVPVLAVPALIIPALRVPALAVAALRILVGPPSPDDPEILYVRAVPLDVVDERISREVVTGPEDVFAV